MEALQSEESEVRELVLFLINFVEYLGKNTLNHSTLGSQPKLLHDALKFFVDACGNHALNQYT